jgi:SAM-dependent methyltransferase
MCDFGIVPKSGFFLKNVGDLYPKETLRFHYCLDCAGVFREDVQLNAPDYSSVDRSTARQMPLYLNKILSNLDLKDDEFLIEVGSNDGSLLEKIKSVGVKKILGIEPSKSLSQLSKNNGFQVECTHLDRDSSKRILESYGFADVVICRHTLEHVPCPRDFLDAICLIMKDSGRLFLEVPSLKPIIDSRLHGHEFWDEHLSYFSEETLQNMLIKAGFKISEIESREHCGSENILCWAIKQSHPKISQAHKPIKQILESSKRFDARWGEYIKNLHDVVKELPRPIAALGASHPQTNFINFTNLSSFIDFHLDDDPKKKNLYVPSSNSLILPTEDMVNRNIATIIDTAFGYPKWIRRAKDKIKRDTLYVLNPLNIM